MPFFHFSFSFLARKSFPVKLFGKGEKSRLPETKEANMNFKALPMGLVALFFLPLQVSAALHLEFGIEPNYSIPFKNPAGGYYSDLNKDFKTGKYTFTTPIPQWKDIKTPSSIDFGVEGSLLYRLKFGKIKNFRVGVVAGYKGSSSRSNYNESYDIWDEYYKGGSYIPTNFKRQEDISTSTISLGARKKASLTDKLDVSSTIGVNFYKVKGDVDYTMDRLDNPYMQWRKADYKGNGTGLSIEADVDYKITDNILIGAGLGYRGGKVKTKGKEVVSWPDTTYTVKKDYSPEFNFNSAYGKAYFGIRF